MTWNFQFVSADKEKLKKEIHKQFCPHQLRDLLCEHVDLTAIALSHPPPGMPQIEQYGILVVSSGQTDPTNFHGEWKVVLTKLM